MLFKTKKHISGFIFMQMMYYVKQLIPKNTFSVCKATNSTANMDPNWVVFVDPKWVVFLSDRSDVFHVLIAFKWHKV